MKINCPKCLYEVANMETFKLLGHTADYWIDLQAIAEKNNIAEVVEENIRLKAKLYDIEITAGKIEGILKK